MIERAAGLGAEAVLREAAAEVAPNDHHLDDGRQRPATGTHTHACWDLQFCILSPIPLSNAGCITLAVHSEECAVSPLSCPTPRWLTRSVSEPSHRFPP